MYKKFLKRGLDFFLAVIMFLLASPIFILAMILLLFINKGKIFFTQVRPGLNERLFKIIKFKTMNDRKDEHGNYLPASDRLTFIGKIIRKSSIDELPQLINVIKGDMSIVGPRPLRVEYLKLYSKEQARRHKVKPGITGLAQTKGRNSISWEEKFKWDVFYVDNLNLCIDLKILRMTFLKVLKSDGINDSNNSIVKPFKNVKLNG